MSSIGPARPSIPTMRTTASALGLGKKMVTKSMLKKACADIIEYTTKLNAGKFTGDTGVYDMLQLYATNLQKIFRDVTYGHINAYNSNVYSAFNLLILTEDNKSLIDTFSAKEDFDVSKASHRAALREIARLLLANIPSNTSSRSTLAGLVAANENYRTSRTSRISGGRQQRSKRNRKQRRRYTRRQK